MNYYTYIMASKPNGTLYIGMTNNITRRVFEHKNGISEGFTKKYNVKRLVYFESHGSPEEAITHEKHLKSRLRREKIELIEAMNPMWEDLYYKYSE